MVRIPFLVSPVTTTPFLPTKSTWFALRTWSKYPFVGADTTQPILRRSPIVAALFGLDLSKLTKPAVGAAAVIPGTTGVAVGSFNSPRSDTLSFGYHLPSFANTTGVFASAVVTPVIGDPSGFTFVAS